jgi:hypothetical protein
MSDINEVDINYTTQAYGFTEELTEENFYIPSEAEYEDFGEEVEEHDAASLWENIRKKKEREGKDYKPAKRGDKDRPDPDAWKKAQSEPSDKQKKALIKIKMVKLLKKILNYSARGRALNTKDGKLSWASHS